MKEITLNGGFVTLVDDEDYHTFSKSHWTLHKAYNTCYARTGVWNPTTKQNMPTYLHREIMKPEKGMYVDHIDGNGLNNQRANLRVCSNAENCRNSKGKQGMYKGVSYTPYKKYKLKSGEVRLTKVGLPYRAIIMVNYKWICVGYFDNEKEAAIAYNRAAQSYFGEFSNLNIIK